MKNLWILGALSITLLCGGKSKAQNFDSERLGLPPARILAMSPEQWAETYIKVKKDASEVGNDEAYQVYENCLKERTERDEKAISAAQRAKLHAYRKQLTNFTEAAFAIAYDYAGGGTIYTHGGRRALVSVEKLTGEILASYRDVVANSVTRKKSESVRMDALLKRVTLLFPGLRANQKTLDELPTKSRANADYNALKKSLVRMESLLKADRSAVNQKVLKFLDNYLEPFKEEH